MAVTDSSYGGLVRTTAVTAGTTSAAVLTTAQCYVTCQPGGGGTMTAPASWSSRDAIAANTAVWQDWNSGTVSATTTEELLGANAVRFVATTAAGVGEVTR